MTFYTENRNTIIHVLDKKNDFNNLKLCHITSGLTKEVNIVRFNMKNILKLS